MIDMATGTVLHQHVFTCELLKCRINKAVAQVHWVCVSTLTQTLGSTGWARIKQSPEPTIDVGRRQIVAQCDILEHHMISIYTIK